MKKWLILSFIILLGICVQAQKRCKDVVHPTDFRKSILNCCIKEIKPGNIVVYTLDGEVYDIEAVAVNYKGEYFDLQSNTEIVNIVKEDQYPCILYEGHDYDYYQELYKKASGQVTLGITLAALGGGFVIGGTVLIVKNFSIWEKNNGVGAGLLLIGVAGIASGIPVAIIGSKKKRANKSAMDNIKSQASLSLCISNYGAQLVLKF